MLAGEMDLIDRLKGCDSRKVIEKVKQKLKLAEEFPSLDKEITLIYGLPGQTLKSFVETLEWCRTNTTARVISFPLMLLRGTPLYDRRHQLQLVEGIRFFSDERRLSDHIPHVVSTPSMTEADWWKMKEIAQV